MIAAARRAEAHDFIAALGRPQGPPRLRRARRRARREAVRRPAPAHRDRARDAEGRADPAARRGDERARLRSRGRDPGEPLPADGRQDGGRDRAPAVDDRRDGPADRARPRPHRRGRRPPQRCSRRAASTRGCGRTRAAASCGTRTTKTPGVLGGEASNDDVGEAGGPRGDADGARAHRPRSTDRIHVAGGVVESDASRWSRLLGSSRETGPRRGCGGARRGVRCG